MNSRRRVNSTVGPTFLDEIVDPNLIYVVLGCIIIGIFTIWLEGLLRTGSYRIIAAICTVQFLAAIVLHFTKSGQSSSAAMLAPLPTLIYFRLCRRVFINIVHREPVNVAYNWDSGLFEDRVFAFTFIAGAVGVLLFAIELAKVGW